jgi:hypothetical protein
MIIKIGYGDFILFDNEFDAIDETNKSNEKYTMNNHPNSESNYVRTQEILQKRFSTISLSSKEILLKNNRNFKSYFKDFLKCIISDQEYKIQMIKRGRSRGINSVSKCDQVSRILFPVLFLTFNFIYWYKFGV